MSAESNRYFSLNALGSAIWECLEKPQTLDEIVEFICGSYAVESEQARSDIVEFLEILAARKLVIPG